MKLSFQSVTLDTETPDSEATLVFRNGRLLAVLSCLSAIHDELRGQWFVETAFAELPRRNPPVFETPEQFGDWVGSEE